jgi:hypothetical protein
MGGAVVIRYRADKDAWAMSWSSRHMTWDMGWRMTIHPGTDNAFFILGFQDSDNFAFAGLSMTDKMTEYPSIVIGRRVAGSNILEAVQPIPAPDTWPITLRAVVLGARRRKDIAVAVNGQWRYSLPVSENALPEGASGMGCFSGTAILSRWGIASADICTVEQHPEDKR